MENTDFRFRLYAEDDLNKLDEIMEDYLGSDQLLVRKLFFSHMTRQNPYLGGRSPYSVVEKDDRIVAYVGQMPTYFVIDGEVKEGYYSHDTLVNSAYRGHGLGPKLIEYQKKVCGSFLVALWFNRRNHRAYQKGGWTDVPGLRPFSTNVRSEFWLSKRIASRKVVKMISPLVDGFLRIKLLGLKAAGGEKDMVEEVDHYGEDIDEFVKRVSNKCKIIMLRKSCVLNWKYAGQKPENYRRYLLRKDKTVCGYMVTRVFTSQGLRSGVVIDFLVDPADNRSFRLLLAHSMKGFLECGAHRVSVLTTNRALIKELHRAGFKQDRDSLPFMATNWEGTYAEDFITNVGNWYVTFGDSDYGFWNPG